MELQRVERHVVNKNDINFPYIDELCLHSKNLYNYVNYTLRQSFIHTGKIPQEFELDHKFCVRNNELFYKLFGNANQQCIKLLYRNWKSFFKSIKDWAKNKEKYLGRPKMPKYKDKNGRNVVIFTYAHAKIRDGYLLLPKKSNISKIKTNVKSEQLKQVRLIPNSNCYIIEIVYETGQIDLRLNKENYLSIDLGIDNFTTCYNSHDNKSFIVNGKIIKSMNQYYNKKRALLFSYVSDKHTSNKLKKLEQKRYNKINDFLHKTSKSIINYCIKYNIGTVIVGHNKNWKQDANMGKRNNQNFVSIPYNKFIQQLQYKCENFGITCIVTEESYTSKIDHLSMEEMHKQENYLGKRVKRGLFKSSKNKVINADLNGAIGILRKVISESEFEKIADRGFVINPVKINVLTKNSL